MKYLLRLIVLCLLPICIHAQTNNYTTIRAEVRFDKVLRPWDGFGFNYVEEAQYCDISVKRQEYGGFSYLDEKSRKEILNLVFGKEGLKPAIIKMFLDPFHQHKAGEQL